MYKVIVRLIRKTLKLGQTFLNYYSRAILEQECRSFGEFAIVEYPIHTLGLNCVTIGSNFIVSKDFKLRAYNNFEGLVYYPNITIGDNFYSGTQSCISAIGIIKIGNNVTLASRVTIIDHSHGRKDYTDLSTPVRKRELTTKGPIIIEDNVWICEGAIILGGVLVGKNAIIAANSVVTKDVPPNCIVGGIPAQIIRTLTP